MNKAEVKAKIARERFTHPFSEEEKYFKNNEDYSREIEGTRKDRLVFLKAFRSAVVPILEKHLKRINLGYILEIGCGTGFFSRHLAPDWLQDKLVSFDINPFSLESIWRSGFKSRIFQGSVYSLPLSNETLDAVIGFSSFDSFIHLDRALKETKRVLKPGGKMILFQDLTTELYCSDDGSTQKGEEILATVECYHSVLIEETEEAGLTILEGKENCLATIEVESMRKIIQRVSDFELEERAFPVLAFWNKGILEPPARPETREASGIKKEDIDQAIEEFGRRLQQNPLMLDPIKAGSGDLVEFVIMRYLVAEKPSFGTC